MTVDDRDRLLGTSRVDVVCAPDRSKLVTLPLQTRAVEMGVRDEVAAHYGLTEQDFTAATTTLDFMVGSIVACLTGTLGGRLAPLGQDTSDGALTVEGEGELVVSGGVIRIRAIDVTYTVTLSADVEPAAVRRAHETHARFCPAARSVRDSIEIRTHLVTT